MSVPIKSLIQKPLALFIRTTCPYCQGAQKMAARHSVTPEVVALDKIGDGDAVKSQLIEMTKQTTVPFVFSRGEFIGGFTELRAKKPEFWDAIKK